jgi:hypothetical protein
MSALYDRTQANFFSRCKQKIYNCSKMNERQAIPNALLDIRGPRGQDES